MAWANIDNAPEVHGARFLVWATPRSDTECAIFTAMRFDDEHGFGIRLDDRYGEYNEVDILKRVTHWMPNPPAPEA